MTDNDDEKQMNQNNNKCYKNNLFETLSAQQP